MRTLRPALARYAPLTSPLWPPPTMIASYVLSVGAMCQAVFLAGLKNGSLVTAAATVS